MWLALTAYLVLNDGWYGHGWGDFGVALNVAIAGASFVATAVGIAIRRALRRPTDGHRLGRPAVRRPA